MKKKTTEDLLREIVNVIDTEREVNGFLTTDTVDVEVKLPEEHMAAINSTGARIREDANCGTFNAELANFEFPICWAIQKTP